MKRIANLIKQHVLWLIIGLIIAMFIIMTVQSKPGSEDVDLSFVQVNSDSNMAKGEPSAKAQVVVYTDFLCPYCSQFANDILPKIEKEFIRTGKAQIEVRPVAMIGSDSGIAAEAAFCAADQDTFWSFHDRLYQYVESEIIAKGISTKDENVLTAPIIASAIQGSDDLDISALTSCMTSQSNAAIVNSATKQAMSSGVKGTPYVMINGNHIQGPSYEIMSSVIKAQQ